MRAASSGIARALGRFDHSEDLMRALALTLMLVPSMALAQQPLPAAEDPGECTTTTTVRCTGAAAPYAVMPPPAPAPPVVAPPPPPAAPVAPQIVILDPRRLAGDGWKLTQDNQGCWWRERRTSTDAPHVWGTGLAFWLGGYAAAIIGGMQQGGFNEIGWMPIIGAMVAAPFSPSDTGKALWAIDGFAQAGGFVAFLVGLAAGPDKVERQPIHLDTIGFAGGGSGVALSGRF
jgi:hypothetical protein